MELVVPYLDLVVVTAARDEEWLGFIEVNAADGALVLVDVVGQSFDAVVTQLDDPVVETGEDPWALGVEGKTLHPVALGFEFG
ncbi:hypothetical protein RJT34_12262 [Clitoria ternatea]|uniref:Uncharacterized protein n=1 Tax=Clitoria ternatea TaxID=43366 RepID=A0AAN9PKS2_CLITE